MEETAKRTVALRKALGISQRVMGQRGGLDREHVSAIERGKNKATTLMVRQALARAAGVSLVHLNDYLEGRLSLKRLLESRAEAAA